MICYSVITNFWGKLTVASYGVAYESTDLRLEEQHYRDRPIT